MLQIAQVQLVRRANVCIHGFCKFCWTNVQRKPQKFLLPCPEKNISSRFTGEFWSYKLAIVYSKLAIVYSKLAIVYSKLAIVNNKLAIVYSKLAIVYSKQK